MEMNKETLEKMTQLHLRGMFNAFKTSLETTQKESMTIDQFTSWLVVSEWDDVIGEKTVADAVLDRLVHQSLRVELYGESLRKQKLKEDYE